MNNSSSSSPVSSKSGDGVISVDWPVCSVFVVDTLPLEVVVVLNVDCAMENWLPHVDKEEERQDRESNSSPVTRETNVQHAISLVGCEWSPIPPV